MQTTRALEYVCYSFAVYKRKVKNNLELTRSGVLQISVCNPPQCDETRSAYSLTNHS